MKNLYAGSLTTILDAYNLATEKIAIRYNGTKTMSIGE